LTLRGPRLRRSRARLVPCRATAGLPHASSCKPATVWPPHASHCRSPYACRRWALCASHHWAAADSREAHMVFGFWSRSKEERGCLPALANFRAWLPHNKQIIERSHGRNKGIRTGVTGTGDGLRLWTMGPVCKRVRKQMCDLFKNLKI